MKSRLPDQAVAIHGPSGGHGLGHRQSESFGSMQGYVAVARGPTSPRPRSGGRDRQQNGCPGANDLSRRRSERASPRTSPCDLITRCAPFSGSKARVNASITPWGFFRSRTLSHENMENTRNPSGRPSSRRDSDGLAGPGTTTRSGMNRRPDRSPERSSACSVNELPAHTSSTRSNAARCRSGMKSRSPRTRRIPTFFLGQRSAEWLPSSVRGGPCPRKTHLFPLRTVYRSGSRGGGRVSWGSCRSE